MKASEPRDIYLSALANNTASRLSSTVLSTTGNRERGVQARRGRIVRETFVGEGGVLGMSRRMVANGQSAFAGVSPQSPRASRYSARVARKSSSPDLLAQSLQQEAKLRSSSGPKRAPNKSIGIFSPASYSALVTISIALLAWSFITPAAAALSCDTNADCSVKGVGTCKQEHNYGASTCVYKSCAAGFWGAGNTYRDCFDCPHGMTSLEGKAFYVTDCFIPCGDERCYKPENGDSECTINPATATPMCFSTCNADGYTVLNAAKPYATCVKEAIGDTSLTNQSGKRKVVKLMSRGETKGRKLKLKANVDLRTQGPAVALMRNAGRDPLALVSK